MSHWYWNEDVCGVFNGLAIIFSDAPVGNTSVTVITSTFNHNLYHRNCDAFRIGCMATKKVNDKSTHHALWDILPITDSKIFDNCNEYSYTNIDFNHYITSNHYNHWILYIGTSTSVSVNLTIHLDHSDYIQIILE